MGFFTRKDKKMSKDIVIVTLVDVLNYVDSVSKIRHTKNNLKEFIKLEQPCTDRRHPNFKPKPSKLKPNYKYDIVAVFKYLYDHNRGICLNVLVNNSTQYSKMLLVSILLEENYEEISSYILGLFSRLDREYILNYLKNKQQCWTLREYCRANIWTNDVLILLLDALNRCISKVSRSNNRIFIPSIFIPLNINSVPSFNIFTKNDTICSDLQLIYNGTNDSARQYTHHIQFKKTAFGNETGITWDVKKLSDVESLAYREEYKWSEIGGGVFSMYTIDELIVKIRDSNMSIEKVKIPSHALSLSYIWYLKVIFNNDEKLLKSIFESTGGYIKVNGKIVKNALFSTASYCKLLFPPKYVVNYLTEASDVEYLTEHGLKITKQHSVCAELFPFLEYENIDRDLTCFSQYVYMCLKNGVGIVLECLSDLTIDESYWGNINPKESFKALCANLDSEDTIKVFGCLSPYSDSYSKMMTCSNEQLQICIERDMCMSDLGRYILEKLYAPLSHGPPPYEHVSTDAPPPYEPITPASAPPLTK